MSDQMPSRVALHERLLVASLLNAILADARRAGGDGFGHSLCGKRFGNRDERDVAPLAARARACVCDSLFDSGEVLNDRHAISPPTALPPDRAPGSPSGRLPC